MVSNVLKLTLVTTALLASACTKTETPAAVEKPAGTHSANVQPAESKPTANVGNIVALPETGGKEYMVGPKGNALVRIKLTAEDTGGAYEIITEDHPKGFESEPHIHPVGAETFYVIEGEYEYYFGDVKGTASAGTVWHVPPGIVHVIRAKTDGKVMMVYSPPGIVNRTERMGEMTPEQKAVPGAVPARLSELGHVSVDPNWIKARRDPASGLTVSPPPASAPTARGGNIVALTEEGGKKYIVGPNGDAVVKIKVTAEDTGGAYEVVTEDHPKGFESNPHIHPFGSQSFYVVKGEYEYYFDDVKGTAGPGAVWHVPPGVVHVIHAKTEGQVVLVYSPVKFQERIEAMRTVTKEQKSDPKFMAAKLLELDVVNKDPSWLEERR